MHQFLSLVLGLMDWRLLCNIVYTVNVSHCAFTATGLSTNFIPSMISYFQGTHLPSKISSLYGVLYVLEAGDADVSKIFVSTIMDYLVKYLGKFQRLRFSLGSLSIHRLYHMFLFSPRSLRRCDGDDYYFFPVHLGDVEFSSLCRRVLILLLILQQVIYRIILLPYFHPAIRLSHSVDRRFSHFRQRRNDALADIPAARQRT